MIKKILLIAMLITVFSGIGVYQSSPVLAQGSQIQDNQFKFDLGVVTHKDIKERNWIRKGLDFIFERVITIMAATVGAAAVLMMAIGGFMMISSAGTEERYTKGKGMIMRAIMGLGFVLGAYILVTTVQLLIKSIFTG